jgi:DNA-binding CsgD family transcriptional regulator
VTTGVLILDGSGRVTCATRAASRLLESVDVPSGVEHDLKALSARCSMAGEDHTVVMCLPLRDGGRVVLTGALTGTQIGVVVDEQPDAVDGKPLFGFTAREREVLRLVGQGFPTKRIAALLCISPWTVQEHVRSMFSKAGVRTRGELIALVHARDPAASSRRALRPM